MQLSSNLSVVTLSMLTILGVQASAKAQQGACCLSQVGQNDCVQLDANDCALAGGTFGGAGSECPDELVVALQLSGVAMDLFLRPAVGCADVGTTGASCVDAPGPLVDAWVTSPPGIGEDSCHAFGVGPESPPIPPGFFGPGSDPFFGTVCFGGQPLGPTPFGDFGLADTLILRSDDPFDRCDLPSPSNQQPVDIQLVDLNLVSSQPIIVTFNGGQNPEAWDVSMDLSSNGPIPGILNATKTHCNGGTYESFIPVQPRFTFVNPGAPSNVRIFDTGDHPIPPVDLQGGAPWVSELDPGLSKENPQCSEFHPGIEDPSPPVDCPLPSQDRATLRLVSPSTELALKPGVSCADVGTGGLSCIVGPLLDAWRVANPGPGQESFHDFGTVPESPPIPADFFDPGSEPFVGRIFLVGDPLGSTPFGDYDISDTLILRSDDPFDRCELPSPTERTVDIQIVELNLRSIQPIQVIVQGQPTQWDVHVDLSDFQPQPGSLTATKTHCNGGTYTSGLNVQPRFTFTKVDDPLQIRVFDTGFEFFPPVQFFNIDEPWVNDIDPLLRTESPSCSEFYPGIIELAPEGACDCQGNGVRDKCDLETGASSDCNGDALPDECALSIPGDYDANGVVDLGDYASLSECLGGSGSQPGGLPECSDLCRTAFDSDDDTDIDLFDFAWFAQLFAQ
ncbi:MAG: hypothetical protein DHS20C16_32230 [Phycisphaerae bacterium]|nr:MAG: hypothetical protein DHS20C16_32230 [Phycisphaerae bacterium]